MLTLNSRQMYLAEKLCVEEGNSYRKLMDNAGKQCFEVILNQFIKYKNDFSKISAVILCGNGNNGGDGFVIARMLAFAKIKVTVILCDGLPKTTDALSNYNLLSQKNIQIVDYTNDINVFNIIRKSNLIVDAIYGIGFHGELSTPIKTIINLCNQHNCQKIAIDIPSGMECDSGKCNIPTFIANKTITFACKKTAHTIEHNSLYLGEVVVVNIGISETLLKKAYDYPIIIDDSHIDKFLPVRKSDSHKGDYGKLLNFSGNIGYSGAALMSSLAALRCGVGILTLMSASKVIDQIASSIMEATTISLNLTNQNEIDFENAISALNSKMFTYDCMLVGCGLTNSQTMKKIVEHILTTYNKKIILDADGINVINGNIDILRATSADIVLTPHPGEMSRLINKSIDYIESNRVTIAREFAKEYNVILCLKGAQTIIACPNGNTYINVHKNPGLAKGGSGDVLSGMISGFSAMGLSLEHATVCGVYLHGKSAYQCCLNMSAHSVLPRDIINTLPLLLKSFNK